MPAMMIKKKPTIKDLAKVAGVSHATVSMVFSGEKRISQKTREKVLAAARKLKYVPNLGASNLRKGESQLIGFIVNDIANPVYGKMAQVAEAIALANGYQLIIADHQWNPDGELAAIKKMISFRAKGLLWCGTEQSAAVSELLAYVGAPTVVALDNCPRDHVGGFVGYNVRYSGAIAAQHLLENGVKNPLLFTVNRNLQNLSNFVELQEGFLETLKKHNISNCEHRLVFSGLTPEEGREAFHRLQGMGREPVDGILAINDLCAYGIMGAADELGLKIGEDIALMGIGNHSMSSMPRISLTSIAQSAEQIVRAAMEELFTCFAEDRPSSMRVSFPGELVVRKSSSLKVLA